MCLGIPGRITQITDTGFLRMGVVDFGGVTREVCLSYVPEAGVGEYVIVHVGFAINRLDEEEAMETLRVLREMGGVEEELGMDPVGRPPAPEEERP
jgi:hydrogenase expression/formation protein HypC